MSFAGAENLLVLLAAACADLIIGLYVFFKDVHDRARQAFLLFVFGGFLWIVGLLLLSVTHLFFFDIVINYGALLLFSGGLWFTTLFPAPLRLPVRPWLLYAPMIIAAVGIIPEHQIVSGIIALPGGGFTPILGPLLPLWSAIICAYALLSIGILIYRYVHTRGHVRLQMKYLLLGMGIFLFSVVIFDTALPALFGITYLNELGPFASVVFVGCTGYAIVRHRLMDIRVVIQRGIMYSVLLGLIISLYVVFLEMLNFLGDRDSGTAFLAAILTTCVGIFGAPEIESYFRRVTDGFFFKDRYDYAEALETLSAVLHTSLELDELVRRSEDALTQTLRALSVHIRVLPQPTPQKKVGRSTQGEVAIPEDTLSIPITLEGTLVGTIDVGVKRSGDPYTNEDAQLLTTFAYQAATALSRAHLYAQVKRHAEELEKKVEERTEELRRAQEQQRQMMLELSHNLQTPLAVLQTKVERLKHAMLHDGEVHAVEQSLSMLSNFIYEFLELARLESGTRPENEAVVDLSLLLTDIAEEIDIIASAQKVLIRHSIAPGINILGDAKQLREALMNIASNALKYMRSEGLREVTFALNLENDSCVISIRDTGVGIEAPDLPHIFEHFYRGKNRQYGVPGTGLGLAIAKRIIEQHGGQLIAASIPGEGTTMTASFPVL